MKKFFTILLTISMCMSLMACSNNNTHQAKPVNITESEIQNATTTKNQTTTNPVSTKEPTTIQEKQYPDFVITLYNNMSQYIKANYNNIKLTSIKSDVVGESTFYNFYIDTGSKTTQPKIRVTGEEKSFDVTLPDKLEATLLKQIISCSVFAAENNMSAGDVDKVTQNIINGFNGNDIETPVSSDSYFFFIVPEQTLLTRSLIAVSKDDINPEINKSLYETVSAESIGAELNVGMKINFTGKVMKDILLYEDTRTHAMEVEWDSNTYIVYYNFDHFIDVFKIGETYTFYGEIAKPRNGYSGCIRIDHAE